MPQGDRRDGQIAAQDGRVRGDVWVGEVSGGGRKGILPTTAAFGAE
jgi:hypothetical protein